MTDFTPKQIAFQQMIQGAIDDYTKTNQFRVIDSLLESLQEIERYIFLRSLFWHALDASHWEIAEHCVSAGYPLAADPKDLSDAGPVRDAIDLLGDCPSAIEWLIAHGAEADSADTVGYTPLMMAAGNGYVDSASVLIKHGADVNAFTSIDGGYSPLLAATLGGRDEIVELLLAHGAVNQ